MTPMAVGYSGHTNAYFTLLSMFPGCAASVKGEVGNDLKVTLTLRTAEVVTSGGIVVDSVPYPTNSAVAPSFVTNFPAPAASFAIGFKSLECYDPRLNSTVGTAPPLWRACIASGADNTIVTKTNSVTIGRWNLDRNPPVSGAMGLDWDTLMHVSNAGRLRSVGELGNLLRTATPFSTIRLFDHALAPAGRRDPVLDRFTVTSPSTAVKKGCVNPNTGNKDVWRSILSAVPLGYPESTLALSEAEVGSLADAFVNFTGVSTNVFTNVSDVGILNFRTILTGRTDLDRESVIAHTCGLLGTRQNLFTIFVAAGPFAPGQGIIAAEGAGTGDWLGYQRAVFEVWRDPFPDAQGRHPWFVRLFKLLEGGD
jgi:hypothetical protein